MTIVNDTPTPLPSPSPSTSTSTLGSKVRSLPRPQVAHVVLVVGLLAWIYLFVVQGRVSERVQTLSATLATAEKDLAQLRAEHSAAVSGLNQVQAERAELGQLLDDVRRSRDELLLIEVERLLNAAASELQRSGQVGAALRIVQAADDRLARADGAATVLTVRRALARDMERLQALPSLDVTGIALRLDEAAVGVEAWPMLADPTTPLAGKSAVPQKSAQGAAQAKGEEAGYWAQTRRWLSQEFGDLVRIREAPTPEAVSLSASGQQLVRHQIRLRLLDARHALIARNEKLYRADLLAAHALVRRYFDIQSPGPAAAVILLDKLANSTSSIEAPNVTLSESMGAIQNALAATRGAPRP